MPVSSLDLVFPSVHGKEVVGGFTGEDITSNSGVLLLGLADRRMELLHGVTTALRDQRDSTKVVHSLKSMLEERIFGIAAGYEDANDLDKLRHDPALKVACGRLPGSDAALASQPTISRLEHSANRFSLMRAAIAMARCVVKELPANTKEVVLDVDATEDPCYGQQQLSLFNAHYDNYCYLPLLMYVTGPDKVQRLMTSVLRPGTAHGTDGLRTMLRWAVKIIRARFPKVRIILRADSGFGCAKTIAWCHDLKIDFVLGLGGNNRLHRLSERTQMAAAIKYTMLKRWFSHITPEFDEFKYAADTWKGEERVIVKTEVSVKKTWHPDREIIETKINPRFVATTLTDISPRDVYNYYCERGDRENRIKEFKVDLSAGRTSCTDFMANQFRLLLHTCASILMCALQEAAAGTRFAKAQVGTLRLAIIKIGARVTQSVRRIVFQMASSAPDQDVWRHIYQKLT